MLCAAPVRAPLCGGTRIGRLGGKRGAPITSRSGLHRHGCAATSRLKMSRLGTAPKWGSASRLTATATLSETGEIEKTNPFLDEHQELQGLQATLAKLPPAGVHLLRLALILGSAAAGWSAAQVFLPVSLRSLGGLGGATFCAFLGATVGGRAIRLRNAAFGAELGNTLASHPNLEELTRADIVKLERRFGSPIASLAPETAVRLYAAWISSVVPHNGVPLRGDEAARCVAFKTALDLPDDLAGRALVDVGREMIRDRLECMGASAEEAARRDLHRLIYVAHLVLGDRSYLTPWTRACGVPAAQVALARRDGARELFRAFLADERASRNGHLDASRDAWLRAARVGTGIALTEEDAKKIISDAVRESLENLLDYAISALQTGDRKRAAEIAERAVGLNRDLYALREAIAGDDAYSPVARGIGPGSVTGGVWASSSGRLEALRALHRAVAEENIAAANNEWTSTAVRELSALREATGLGIKESESIEKGVRVALYFRLLHSALEDGSLDAAASPAAILRDLVHRCGVDPEEAAEMHADEYRKRLGFAVSNRTLSTDDVVALTRLQRVLCIPAATREGITEELTVPPVREALEAAAASAAAGDSDSAAHDVATVVELAHSLRVDETILRRVANDVGIKYLVRYAAAARSALDAEATVARVREMISFADTALLPTLRALFPDETEAEREGERGVSRVIHSVVEPIVIGPDGFVTHPPQDSPSSSFAVTLESQLHLHERVSIYRTFMQSVQTPKLGNGDEAKNDVGFQTNPVISDETLHELAALAGLLGLTLDDVTRIHQETAVVDFRKRAHALLSAVNASPEPSEDDAAIDSALRALASASGLSEEVAEGVIASLHTSTMVASLQAAQRAGTLRLDMLERIRTSGVDVSRVLSRELRSAILRSEISAALSNGRGEFDVRHLLERAAEDLGLDAGVVRRDAEELVGEKRRATLVQAVSCLRQNEKPEAMAHLNNLVACEIVAPSANPVSWGRSGELQKLFAEYAANEADESKRDLLQKFLGISNSEAAELVSSSA